MTLTYNSTITALPIWADIFADHQPQADIFADHKSGPGWPSARVRRRRACIRTRLSLALPSIGTPASSGLGTDYASFSWPMSTRLARSTESSGMRSGGTRPIRGLWRDLACLPFTRKADYAAALAQRPPWGALLACAPEDVRRVHFSSGTTAQPTPNCWTAQDLDRWPGVLPRTTHKAKRVVRSPSSPEDGGADSPARIQG